MTLARRLAALERIHAARESEAEVPPVELLTAALRCMARGEAWPEDAATAWAHWEAARGVPAARAAYAAAVERLTTDELQALIGDEWGE